MKIKAILPVALSLLLLSACTPLPSYGPAANDIKVNRQEYVEQIPSSPGYDVSPVVSFIEDMNQTLDEQSRITDYTTSYDSATDTVYVNTAQGTSMAFKVDSTGQILFASCNGAPETKALLSQGIAKTLMGSSNETEALFSKIEEARWLNGINMAIVANNTGGFNLDELDISLPDADAPDTPSLDTSLTMPILTEKLRSAGVSDLSDYFESPTLEKYWDDIDIGKMQDEIKDTENRGDAFQDVELP